MNARIERGEADVLAGMMGADSRRVDDLVQDVGSIKGDVREVRSGLAGLVKGVDQLTSAMAVLVTHEVKMQHASAEQTLMRADVANHDLRLQSIERKVGGWDEARLWLIRAGLLVLSTVGLAIVALVLRGGHA